MNIDNAITDIKVHRELDLYKSILDTDLKLNKPFSYLELIADKYNLDKTVVIDRSLDSYNFYRNKCDKSHDDALYKSIIDTHYFIASSFLDQ
ncbi:MAG: hypothetical protein ACLFN8_01735 [Candidatus Woesearchaeota archaeon]